MLDPFFWTVTVAIICTVPCALLGCYLVLRRMSLLGDAISHSVLPGIVLAVILMGRIETWAIVLGAMVFGVAATFLTQAVHSRTRVPEDASMGVVFTTLFALGVVLISVCTPGAHLDDCVLYGVFEYIPLTTVTLLGWRMPSVLPTMVLMLAITLGFIALLWKELKIVAFDPELADAMGLHSTLVHYALMAMVAAVTVTAFQAVGSVLVIAMLIVPAATAHLLTDRLGLMLLLAASVAVVSCVSGVALASKDFLNTNAAGMLAVMAGVHFGLAVLLAPRHGVLARLLRNLGLALRIVSEDILARLYKLEEAQTAGDTPSATRLQHQEEQAASGLTGRLAWRWLRWRGLLEVADGQPRLSPAGREQAARLVRAHRLWESYIGAHFDLPLDHLHAPAERMEHFLDADLQKELAVELEQPGHDPHGRAIPRDT